MSTLHASAMFAVQAWDEQPWEGRTEQADGAPRLTHARVTYSYTGELEGTGTVHYLMVYRADGSASYVGLEQFEGRLGGKAGSFVLQHIGTHTENTAQSACLVVPGSGTGELAGLRGEAIAVAAGHQPAYPFTLDYTFD